MSVATIAAMATAGASNAKKQNEKEYIEYTQHNPPLTLEQIQESEIFLLYFLAVYALLGAVFFVGLLIEELLKTRHKPMTPLPYDSSITH